MGLSSKKRRLQEVEEEALTAEEPIQRSFNWTVVDFDGDEMYMKLNYNGTLTKDRVHRLQLVYNDTAFLKGLESTLVVPAGFKQRVKVPKQESSESKLALATQSISAAIQALTVGNAVFSVFAQSSLSHMWAFINSL